MKVIEHTPEVLVVSAKKSRVSLSLSLFIFIVGILSLIGYFVLWRSNDHAFLIFAVLDTLLGGLLTYFDSYDKVVTIDKKKNDIYYERHHRLPRRVTQKHMTLNDLHHITFTTDNSPRSLLPRAYIRFNNVEHGGFELDDITHQNISLRHPSSFDDRKSDEYVAAEQIANFVNKPLLYNPPLSEL